MNRIILFFFAAVILVSCSNNCDLAIDNPTDEIITLHVDSLYVEVPAKEVVWVEMGKGEHSIKLQNDSLIKFNFTESVYMINPSNVSYFMYEEFYGDPLTMSGASPISKKTINYLGMEMEGNYDVVDEIINKVTWDYGPREKAPEMIEIESGDRAAVVKLLDPYEFIAQMMERAGESVQEEG